MPGAGDEEYQSIVFDDAFVRAARIQEFSAEERLTDRGAAVRTRVPERAAARTVPRQGIVLALIILLAFAAAIYLGSDNVYDTADGLPADPPAGTFTALAPAGAVPGAADAAAALAGTPAASLGVGQGGVELPDPRATDHFSREQVLTALTLAKEYVVASALTPDVLTGATAVPVRDLLGSAQQRQFDRALAGEEAATAVTDWLVRFDTERVVLAGEEVRVGGSFAVAEATDDVLQVTGDHVLAYAVRAVGDPDGRVALFTVRRQIRLQFGEDELRDRNVVLRQADTQAGPLDCGADTARALVPLLAGERAAVSGAAGTDPYATPGTARAVLCGTLAAPGR
jgi:hypothetical protein